MVINLLANGQAGYSFVMEHHRAPLENAINWQLISMFPVHFSTFVSTLQCNRHFVWVIYVSCVFCQISIITLSNAMQQQL
jgi:hypothetical protein